MKYSIKPTMAARKAAPQCPQTFKYSFEWFPASHTFLCSSMLARGWSSQNKSTILDNDLNNKILTPFAPGRQWISNNFYWIPMWRDTKKLLIHCLPVASWMEKLRGLTSMGAGISLWNKLKSIPFNANPNPIQSFFIDMILDSSFLHGLQFQWEVNC